MPIFSFWVLRWDLFENWPCNFNRILWMRKGMLTVYLNIKHTILLFLPYWTRNFYTTWVVSEFFGLLFLPHDLLHYVIGSFGTWLNSCLLLQLLRRCLVAVYWVTLCMTSPIIICTMVNQQVKFLEISRYKHNYPVVQL